PDWMCTAGVADCFKTVILSSKVRLRKPDPAIYLLAARCIGSAPAQCAYVGDNPVRDVEGALDAKFGCMVLFEDAGTADREGKTPTKQPHCRIRSIPELLDLFKPLEAKK
ncbi:MAG: HAD family hydrolase, partial [Clostridiales bacterium]|nr:HAD family hydrolase [Clostridiales bacterium]